MILKFNYVLLNNLKIKISVLFHVLNNLLATQNWNITIMYIYITKNVGF
jgi:hypothetical protein